MRRKKFSRSKAVHSISTNARKRTTTIWFPSGARYRYPLIEDYVEALLIADEKGWSVGSIFSATYRKVTTFECLKQAPRKAEQAGR